MSGIYKIFENSFYYGLIKRKEGIFFGKHEPMITEREYWKAQEILGRKGKPKPKTHTFAFTGLIRYKKCGGVVTAEEKINRYGYHYIYYHCTKRKSDTNCRQPSIRLEELEKQIKEYLSSISISNEFIEWALKYLKKLNEEEKVTQEDIRRSANKALKQNQKNFDALIKMRYRGLISDEEFLMQKSQLLKEQFMLKRKLENVENEVWLASAKSFFVFANQAKEKFENGCLDTKRVVLKTLGSNLFLKDKKLSIEAKKPFQVLEKRSGVTSPQISRLELAHNSLTTPKFAPSFSHIRSWCARIGNIRTFFMKNPDFDVQDLGG